MTSSLAVGPRWRSWPASILAVAAGVTPPLAVLAPLSLIIVLSITAISIGALSLVIDRSLPLSKSLLLVMVPFALWSSASVFWAVDAMLAVKLLQSVLMVALGGIVLVTVAGNLNEAERTRIESWLTAGFVVALILLGALAIIHSVFGTHLVARAGLSRTVEWFSHNRGATALALLVWPTAAIVRRRYGLGAMIAVIAATFVALLGFDSTAASLALPVGGGVALLARIRPRLIAGTMIAGIVAVSVLVPVLPRLISFSELIDRPLPTAVYHRLVIWDFAAGKIAERPLLGWGFNASRVLPGGDAHVVHGPSGNMVPLMPLHPHNAILQLWIELGLPGAVLGAALAILAIRGIQQRSLDAMWQPAAFGLAAAGLVVAFFSYGIWQRWWMSALWLAPVFMIVAGRPVRGD